MPDYDDILPPERHGAPVVRPVDAEGHVDQDLVIVDGGMLELAVPVSAAERFAQIDRAFALDRDNIGDPDAVDADEALFLAAAEEIAGDVDEDGGFRLEEDEAGNLRAVFDANPAQVFPREDIYAPPTMTAAGARPAAAATPAAAAGPVAEGFDANALARTDTERAVMLAAEPVWLTIGRLPGYQAQAIRTLGRTIFRTFPCFRRMEDDCRAAGRDPLGELRCILNMTGQMNRQTQAEMQTVANWIRGNGNLVAADNIDFDRIMPGYRPRVVLATSENDSFLMVEDSVQNGAPHNATYIYAWRGGRAFYDAMDNRLADAGRPAPAPVLQIAAEPAAAPAPVAAQARAPEAAAPARPAAPAHAEVRRVGEAPRPAAAPAAAPAQAPDPIAPVRRRAPQPTAALSVSVGSATVAGFRRAGFTTIGTATGPALRKEVGEDGQVAILRGADGAALMRAQRYAVELQQEGHVIAETVVDDLAGFDAWVEEVANTSRPRM